MTDEFRHCPGCGSMSEFVQVHPALGRCPDSASEGCPEWFCASCGAALLLGFLAVRPAAGRLDRVA